MFWFDEFLEQFADAEQTVGGQRHAEYDDRRHVACNHLPSMIWCRLHAQSRLAFPRSCCCCYCCSETAITLYRKTSHTIRIFNTSRASTWYQRTRYDQWRSDGGAGRTGRHLLGAAKGRKTPKIKKKIHVKIQIVSFVCVYVQEQEIWANAHETRHSISLILYGCHLGLSQ